MNVLNNYFLSFVSIFVAVDAIGVIPMYLGLTDGISEPQKKSLVRRSTFTALFVALVFLVLGQMVFGWLGITISDFLIAGGIILFTISIRDLLFFEKTPGVSGKIVGVVPLAVPLMVGPAVLTTSLISLRSYGALPTIAAIIANVLLCGFVLHQSRFFSRLLGEAGSHTFSKIANLLLAAIGVMLIRRGVFEIFANLK